MQLHLAPEIGEWTAKITVEKAQQSRQSLGGIPFVEVDITPFTLEKDSFVSNLRGQAD